MIGFLRMQIASLPWILIPGFGQIHLSRPFRGLLLFTLFAACGNAWLVAPWLLLESGWRLGLGLGATVLWILSAADYIRLLLSGAGEEGP